jgi:hypothetical protein
LKKYLLLLTTLTSMLLSCTGDCFSCHPQLLENLDTNHKPMLLCKNCHLDTGSASQCGADCFECHKSESISTDIEEHKVIDNCRECHLKKVFMERDFSPFTESGELRKFLEF